MMFFNRYDNDARRSAVVLQAALALHLAATGACTYPLSTTDDQRYVGPARQTAAQTLGDPLLERVLGAIPASAIDHASDPQELADDSGTDVLRRLRTTSLDFAVQCRRTANFKTWAWEGVATDAKRTVSLRCAWFDRQPIVDWSGTLVHELAHHAGYWHRGNARAGNECTVPHLFADAVIHVASLSEDKHAELSPKVCPALKLAVVVVTGA